MGNVYRAFKDEALPDNYFRVQVKFLRYLGVELMDEETVLYRIYSKIILFYIVIVTTSVEIYEVYAQWGNLNIVVGICNYLITRLTGLFKIWLLYWNRKKIGNMMKSFQAPPFQPNEFRGGLEEEAMIRDVIRATEKLLLVYFTIVSGTVFTGIIKVTIARFTTPHEDWEFPYAPTMTFADFSESPWYEAGCLFQFMGAFSFGFLIATTYILLSSILAHISVQMRILGNAFRNILPRARKMQAANNNRPLEYYLNVAMKETIKHHLDTLLLADEMELLCSLMILVVFLASVVLLCFLLYFSSLFPYFSMSFLQNFCYYWIIVFQVGMYCYWGNEVTLEAYNVTQAIAEMDWIEAPPALKKAVVMITARAQIPLYITAGKFVPLSMTSFVNIIKGSFSYFTMLRQRQEMQM